MQILLLRSGEVSESFDEIESYVNHMQSHLTSTQLERMPPRAKEEKDQRKGSSSAAAQDKQGIIH